MKIVIENINGQWLINGKRLNYDNLTFCEIRAINDFFKEYKDNEKSK